MFFPNSDWNQALADAAASPLVPHPDEGIASAVGAFSDAAHTGSLMATAIDRDEVINDLNDAFQKVSGRTVAFPQSPAPGRGAQYAVPFGQFRAEVDAWNAQHPDQLFDLPSNDEIENRALARERAAQQSAAARSGAAQSLGANIGNLAGSMGAGIVNPVNVGAFAVLGAGPAAGIIRGAIGDAVAGMAGQAADQAFNYGHQQQLDPNYGLGDVAQSIGEAGLMGAGGGLFARGVGKVIGAALKTPTAAAARMWRDMRGTDMPVPREVVDAGNVVDTASHIQDSNPLGAEWDTEHAAAMAESYRAAAAGEVPDIPPEVEAAASELPAETVDRQMRAENPEMMDRLYALNQQADANDATLRSLTTQISDPRFRAVRAGMLAADEQQATVDRLQSAVEKEPDPAAKARLQSQVDAATDQLRTTVQSVSRNDIAELDRLEYEMAQRRQVQEWTQNELDRQTTEVNQLRSQKLNDYWDQKFARARGASVPEGTEAAAGQIREAVNKGDLPQTADIEADLASAKQTVSDADTAGVPLDQYLAGKTFMDGVTPRVRAIIGLMHDGPDLAYRVKPEEFAARIQKLADMMTGKDEADAAPPVAADTPELSAVASRSALDAAQAAFDTVKLADDDEARAVVINDGQKMVAENPDTMIETENGPRRLADVLDEADNEILAADELRACSLGRREG